MEGGEREGEEEEEDPGVNSERVTSHPMGEEEGGIGGGDGAEVEEGG